MTERLVVASGNPHKVVELEAMLAALSGALRVRGLGGLPAQYGPAPTIEETADDFRGNAILKAEGIARWLAARGEPDDTWVLADDSGVCVDALGGGPGVRSARFAGDDATDEDNNARLVQRLGALGQADSPGHYACVLALATVGGAWGRGAPTRCFEGRWDVLVSVTRRGTGGFGYDPHCWLATRPGAPVDDAGRGHAGEGAKGDGGGESWPGVVTVAELARDEKAAVSHRGLALRALADWWPRRGA